ncbi:TadE/TadG family type IV pilus assembly protein [Auraticoccus monumenti]|uniref:Flp pilus assembly protein TadG n=1 Tax=Auraticoccus monumenti TaxID=675864 RepID=A0A1G6YAW5_9ACTN|nr:TadE/TadG family type IV pilus assembly protein [Auraticoccus monumenti]SDD87634.1 Flp pilus assembly protein TadG [Auraticoccus monumenti]
MSRPSRSGTAHDERGAVNVVVALLMIPLIGFAAIAIDVSAMWSERQQLQTGADASALAIAQDCARQACGTPSATASSLTSANFIAGTASAQVLTPALSSATGRVTVRTSTVTQHVFAPLLGFDQADLSARATVRWGSPTGGSAVLPLAFGWCEFEQQTGGGLPSSTTRHTIFQTKTSDTGCTGPSGNLVPGGFGWLRTDPGTCRASSTISMDVPTDPGSSVPSTCTSADLVGMLDTTVLLPIFDRYQGTGSSATYHVYAYAAFRVTAYHFGGQNSYGSPCNGNDRCIRGYFTTMVELDDAFEYSTTAPQLGASIVSLTD